MDAYCGPLCGRVNPVARAMHGPGTLLPPRLLGVPLPATERDTMGTLYQSRCPSPAVIE